MIDRPSRPQARLWSIERRKAPADFGKVTFTGSTATAGGHTGTIADSEWSVARVNLGSGNVSGPVYTTYSVQSSAGATSGTVAGDGQSFTVSYSAAGGGAQSSAGDGSQAPGYYGAY